MIETYTLADLRRLEKRVSEPIDPERELYDALMRGLAIDRGRVVRYRPVRGGSMTNDEPSDLLYVNTASGTAKASFTTEAQINDTAGMGPIPSVPDSYFPSKPTGIGKTIRIVGRGLVSVQNVAAQTFTWSVRMGVSANITTTPQVLATAAITMTQNVTNKLWEFEGDIVLRIIGAAGANSTVMGIGLITSPNAIPAPGVAEVWGAAAQPGTVATFDTSIKNFFNFNAACNTSNAGNSIQLLQLIVLGLN